MLTLAAVLVGQALSKHSQTLIDNNKQHQTTTNTATHDVGHSRGTVEHDRQRQTMTDNERRTVDRNGDTVRQAEKHRATQQQSTQQWSKISTGLKNELLLKNAAQIYRATAENWASNTRRAAHTAHSKHSNRSYALFLRSANSNTAERCYEQRVGRFTASCLRSLALRACGFLTTDARKAAVNIYEQEIRKNCSNCVSR